ncbi:MAG: manganese efflux pump MntP family protein [Bacteroidales bacterium]|nr:manganese efflux pump MntP family protein [Bacteroidales bacterium]MCF8333751.1 manganese efflux pump MntP family protein [Bacteroidales bacterium]
MKVDLLIVFLIMLAISTNFLSFTLGTEVRMKSRVLGPTIAFGVVQFLMFMIGWGLINLIAPLLESSTHVIFQVIVLFLGIKRIFRFFTVKTEARAFQLVHIVDAITLSIAVAVDALIIGLGMGAIDIHFGRAIGLLVPLTILMSLIGIGFRRKNQSKDNGRSWELISGLILLALGVYFLTTIL